MVPLDPEVTLKSPKSLKKLPETVPEDYDHLRCFLPLLRAMQILGALPLSISTSTTDKSITVKMIKTSFIFVFSWSVFGVQIFLVVCMILNREYNITWPFNIFRSASEAGAGFYQSGVSLKVPVLEKMDRIFQLYFPISGCFHVLAARLRSQHLQIFLSNWAEFSRNFQITFHSLHSFQIRSFKKFTIRLLIFYCVFITLIVISRASNRSFLSTESRIGNILLSNGVVLMMFFSNSSPTILTLYSLQAIRLGFREVRRGIEARSKISSNFEQAEIKNWFKLLINLRNQAQQFEKYAGFYEILDLLSNFVSTLTLSYFLIIMASSSSATGEGLVPSILANGIGTVVVALTRNLAKGSIAEKITEEEEKLGMELIDMSDKCGDCEALFEMKLFNDTILTNPTVIRLHNIVNLNKRLTLSLISQLAANLVVILQFKRNGSEQQSRLKTDLDISRNRMTPLEISYSDVTYNSFLNKRSKSNLTFENRDSTLRNGNSNPSDRETNSNSAILKLFLPSLQFFRLAGVSDLYVSEVDGTPIVKTHKKLSFSFLYVFTIAIFQIFLVTCLILNTIFDKPFPVRIFRNLPSQTSSSGRSFDLKTIFQVFYPISGSLQVILARINFGKMATFLNNWTIFMVKYNRTFNHFYKFNSLFLQKFRRNLLIGSFIFFLIFFASRVSQRAAFGFKNQLLNAITSNLFTAYFTFTTICLTMLTLIGLQTIRMAFQETRLGIQKQFVGKNKCVSREDVKAWTQLVMDVRSQVSALQKFTTLHELVDLISNFIILLTLCYNIVTSTTGNGSQQTLVTFGVLAVILGFLRMSLRGMLSDRITREEELLAFAVVDMNIKPADSNDCGARLEMKILCETIFSNPTVFTLGNVITVNKRLVLSLISHLAANLVVILQFKSNELKNK